jgi:hypothetical protein
MGLSALRIAGVPLAVAFLLPSLSASPAAAPRPVRPTLKFQENYKDRLVRVREEGESWLEEASSETYKIKAVLPIDRDLVDVDTFDMDTEFWFNIGEAYYGGVLGDDPRYVAGNRSARVVVDEEEWFDDNENEHYRPITIVNLKWTASKWTISVAQRPYKDWTSWEDDGFWLAAPDWAYPEPEEGAAPVDQMVVPFSSALEGGAYFSLGGAAMGLGAQFEGVAKLRHVAIGGDEDGEVYDLGSARLRGSGSVSEVPEDAVEPTIGLDAAEEQTNDAGVLEGIYVTGSIADVGSGLYAVTARVDGGPPILLTSFDLWFDGVTEPYFDALFDGFVPVSSPSGTIVITVFDLAKNSKTITIPYGTP